MLLGDYKVVFIHFKLGVIAAIVSAWLLSNKTQAQYPIMPYGPPSFVGFVRPYIPPPPPPPPPPIMVPVPPLFAIEIPRQPKTTTTTTSTTTTTTRPSDDNNHCECCFCGSCCDADMRVNCSLCPPRLHMLPFGPPPPVFLPPPPPMPFPFMPPILIGSMVVQDQSSEGSNSEETKKPPPSRYYKRKPLKKNIGSNIEEIKKFLTGRGKSGRNKISIYKERRGNKIRRKVEADVS